MSRQEEHAIEWIDSYLHGLLDPEGEQFVEEHCAECPICEVALREGRRRMEAVQAVPVIEASEALIQSTIARVKRAEQSQTRRRKWVIRLGVMPAAACIVLLAGLHLYYLNLEPSPYDLRVYGQNQLMAGTPASLRVQVFNRDKSTPVENVPVEIELRRTTDGEVVKLASFTTDERGTASPRFTLPQWPDGQYELRIIARTPEGRDTLSRPVEIKRSWKLMLSTDKPVYQPGQTIRMRGLALRQPDLKPVAGEEAVFTLTDPKGNMIFKHRAVTSRYGISSADCPTAVEITEGSYQITCAVGDTESSTTVEIKRYVLPKFKIDIQLDRPYYQPGQRIRGHVQTDYFFGKPVAGGEVRIELAADEAGPTVIAGTTVKTDAAGRAEFDLLLPSRLVGLPQEDGDARVRVRAKVTDEAGQSHSTSVSRRVTTQPLRVEVIPEAGRLVRGVPNTIYLLATYADGRPARTRLSIAGETHELQTSELGLATLEITPQQDKIRLIVRATDEGGLTTDKTIELECGPKSHDFLIRTDRAVYHGGDTVQLSVIGGGADPVFIDFIKDGQNLLTESVELASGRGQLQFDIPPDVFGTIELNAYRFGTTGLANHKTRVIYVHQAGQVRISAAMDRDEYRPGGQAAIDIRLTDETGKPAPGAVSLAAVDEAVFSVLTQAPGMEQTFFNLEQELLRPIYAIYNWSPDLHRSDTSPERLQLEKALFSRTAKTPQVDRRELEQLVEQGLISPRTLEVLEYEELNEILGRWDYSPELRAIIHGNNTRDFFSASYPQNRREIQHTRRDGLKLVYAAWVFVGIGAGAVAIVMIFLWLGGTVLAALLTLLSLLLMVSILLPSLARARELSVRTVASANLRSIDNALRMSVLEERTPKTIVDTTEPAKPVHVREWFPETLLWRPELITDDQGRLRVEVDLADSITTWRLSASAVTGEGRLGSMQEPIRVFQPFFVDLNLPVALTRGDEIAVPAVVYNYLDEPQTVTLKIEDALWFERLDEPVQVIKLDAGEVASTSFRLRAVQVGPHPLQVTARGSGDVADAIKRQVEVVPDGRPVEQVFNGALTGPVDLSLTAPPEAVAGSLSATLKLYPSSFSQLVEGLDAIFQRPYGCFEQTSSTTYPNVLALDYLRRTNKSVPKVEATARQYIHLGYQRLIGFEVSGGGFDWFGRPPANLTLTAYGLMEFEDMARVHDVDPNLIERTRNWLLKQRDRDGAWSPERKPLHEDPTGGHGNDSLARLSTSAYIGWAVYSGGGAPREVPPLREYLLSHHPESIDDPYVLALVCNALHAASPQDSAILPYVDRLNRIRHTSDDGKLAWWTRDRRSRTTFHGTGRSGEIETTALATLALLATHQDPQTVRGALTWLVKQKDPRGTWYTTQATVLSLKALIEGTNRALGEPTVREIEVAAEGAEKQHLTIPQDQADVMRQLDLTGLFRSGSCHLRLTDHTNADTLYQVSLRYHVPGPPPAEPTTPLAIQLDYDRSELRVGERIAATATVVNHMAAAAPMVMLDLPIPPGFAVDAADFEELKGSGTIAKYDLTPRSVIVYLRQLAPGAPLVLRYGLNATMPVKVTAPPARAYEYYDPDKSSETPSSTITVLPRA